MYLIIKDPTARTISIISLGQALMCLRHNFWYTLGGLQLTKEAAEETAKSIAIKENLCFTPGNEI